MKLSALIEGLDYRVLSGDVQTEVTTLTADSRKVIEGSVFVCIVGAASDGHSFISQVIEKCCSALIVQDGCNVDLTGVSDVTVISVANTRYALAMMSAKYFGEPAKELVTVGITGTKGKTTTTYMIKNVLEKCGIKTGLIGTIETIVGDERIPSKNTTPESYQIHETFRNMADAGCKAVVMEVSSQGLKLDRTAGIIFDIGVFTNLSPDHIGPAEHASFEEYKACKAKLFKQCKVGIINADDRFSSEIVCDATCSIEYIGMSEKADWRAVNVRLLEGRGQVGTAFDCTGLADMSVELAMPGMFSVYNALSAIAVTRHFNVDNRILTDTLKSVNVKGRIELVKVSDDFTLIIDYAHNAMALESLLETLREYKPKRLVCLFGCGGNRSKERRYEMGEVSGKMSDFTVITSDNPRYEEPLEIINDIKSGINKTKGAYIEIPDRREAIKYVIENGQPGDIIVLAGKGHEDYQEIKGVKYPMDERVVIAQIMEELGNK